MGSSVVRWSLPALVVAAFATVAGCGARAPYPRIRMGCERVVLFREGYEPEREYRVLRVIHGRTDEPYKNLRAWLQNKACVYGADAVIRVEERTRGDLRTIVGTAISYRHPNEAR